MFKSTEKYNIYTSEDKNNTTFIAVINKQNNRLMCASTHTVANGIIIFHEVKSIETEIFYLMAQLVDMKNILENMRIIN